MAATQAQELDSAMKQLAASPILAPGSDPTGLLSLVVAEISDFRFIAHSFQNVQFEQVQEIAVEDLTRVIAAATASTAALSAVHEFVKDQRNLTDANRRDRLFEEVRRARRELVAASLTPLTFTLLKRGDLYTLESDTRKAHRDAERVLEAAKAQIGEIVGAARDAAGQVGVGKQAKMFGELAAKNRAEARTWLIGMIVSATAIAGFSLSILCGWWVLPKGLMSSELVSAVAARLILLSLLIFALTLASRNYRTSRHNQTVNQHRQTALDTFQAFVVASEDAETKSTVLLHTTKAIFEPQVSGYLTHEPEPFPQTTIVEILRKLGGGGSG